MLTVGVSGNSLGASQQASFVESVLDMSFELARDARHTYRSIVIAMWHAVRA